MESLIKRKDDIIIGEKKFYNYFLKNTKFSEDISRKILSHIDERRRVYKIFHYFRSIDNPNKGFKCVYKNFFDSHIKIYDNLNEYFVLYEYLKEPIKLKKIIYCSFGKKELEIKLDSNTTNIINQFYLYINILINKCLQYIKDNNLSIKKSFFIDIFSYNNLYISEDETILYYIKNDYIRNFNVLNKKILNFINLLPFIEQTEFDSKKILSDYYNININLFSTKMIIDLEYLYDSLYICKNYDTQLFYIKDNEKIYYEEIEANTVFGLNNDIHNWYFISTTLKNKYSILDLDTSKYYNFIAEKLDDGRKIIQLIYIIPELIDKYNKLFNKYKIPFSFKKKIRLSQLKPLPKRIVSSTKGGNKKSRKLLKIY